VRLWALPCGLPAAAGSPTPTIIMNHSFWRGVFCEADGTPSFSRVATGLIVAFALGWVTHLVWHNNALPDFGGLVMFIGALYGVNKISAAVKGTTGGG
jgi:hypothetical protein